MSFVHRAVLAFVLAVPIVGPLAIGALAARRANDAMHPAVPFGASTWNGSYTCRQGPTHLSLTMQRAPGSDDVDALFVFDALDENPLVPSGSFHMHGAVDAGHVVLAPGAWLVRPPGWITVGLIGDVDQNTFAGVIDGVSNSECTTFKLTKAPANPIIANEPLPLGTSHWIGNTTCGSVAHVVIELTIDQSASMPHELAARMTSRSATRLAEASPGTAKLVGHVDAETGRFVLAPPTFVNDSVDDGLFGLNGLIATGALTAELRAIDRITLSDDVSAGDDDVRCEKVVFVPLR